MNSSKPLARAVGKIAKFVKWLALVGIGVFLALSLLCGIVSCAMSLKNEIEDIEKTKASYPASRMVYVEFDGHEYVMLRGGGDAGSGITHSPRCQCLQKEEP